MTETPTATDQLRDAIQRVLNDAQTAWEQLRPTLTALADTVTLPPALAEDLGRQAGSVPEPAPVVVGGRYVVGENPTFAGGARCVVAKPDDVVTITRSEPDEDADVGFRRLQNGQFGWIQPRHLTPHVEPDADAAPEPAAASAVDDDLLRSLHRAAGVGSAWSTKPEEWAARLLASEPMQRLRAAWINAERKAADANWDREVKRVERERDEAYRQKTEWQATAGRIAAERDEARAEVQRERQHVDWLVEKEETANRFKAESDRVLGEIGELVDPWMGSDGRITDGVKAVIAEVKRLRAAQSDPGSYTTELGGQIFTQAQWEAVRARYGRVSPAAQQLPDAPSPESHVMALSQHIGRTSCVCTENGDVCPGHELLDDLAGTLTEAADTISDDEATVPSQATVLRAKFGRRPGSSSASWEQVVEALNVHRARGGQDQPRGRYVGQHIDINLNGQEADRA